MRLNYIFVLLFVHISAQQTYKNIHEYQYESYSSKNSPLTNKIKVLTGLDVLLEKKLHYIDGRKIALVTNHSGVDKQLIPNYKRLMEIDNVELKVIFLQSMDYLESLKLEKKLITLILRIFQK